MRWSIKRPFPGATLPGLLIASLLVMAGCSVGEFLGSYFNTYYNASRAFSEAEVELLNAQDPKLADKGFLAPFVVPAGAKTKFGSVIEKCSKLLQYHPESNFVDDALMMIGKSYYYQNEHQSAERKFRELIDGQPESGLVPEAKVLLANTLYRSGDLEGARKAAREIVVAGEDAFEPGIRSRAALLLAAIELDAKNYGAAVENYSTAAANADSRADRFAALMREADMYVLLKNPLKAGETYSKAEDEASDYLTEYRARLGRAKMLAAVGDHEEALSQLQDLLSNTNNKEMYGEIDFEIGNTYRLMDDVERAVVHYRYVDTAYARTEYSARASYELGLLYEKRLLLYDSARVAYAKGRGAAGQTPVAPLLAQRSDAMNRYAALRSDLAKNESLRVAILFPPDTLAVDTMAAARDSLSAAPDSLATDTLSLKPSPVPDSTDRAALPPPASDTLHSARDSLIARGSLAREDTTTRVDSAAQRKPRWVAVAVPLDTVQSRLALGKSELGALFFNTLEVNDSASYWFTRLLDDHPASIHVPRALYTLAQIARQDSQPDVADSLYKVLADQYGKTEFGGTARKFLGYSDTTDSTDGSEDMYRSGEQALEDGKPEDAVKQFGDLARLHPASPLAAKAEYATGWIYEQILAVPESALTHYRTVAEKFPATPYAQTLRPKLEAVDQYQRAKAAEEQAVRDSISRLEAARKSDSAGAKNAGEGALHDSSATASPGGKPDTTGNQNMVLPPDVQPDTTGNQNMVLPPEVQPDTTGNPNMEIPPEVQPDTTGNGEGDPPPPENRGPGASQFRLP